MLPTQTQRRAALAAFAVIIAAGVSACGGSSGDDPYVPVDNRVTSTPTASSNSTETSVIRTATPTRRATPYTSPAPRPRPQPTIQGSVPSILVGTWSGGSSGETANTSYTFASDGRFLIRRPGGSITGVAVARSGSITFYFSGKSVTSSYSVTELPELYGYQSLNLELGGYSYVRDV